MSGFPRGGSGGVASVSAADTSIVVAGTATNPTIAAVGIGTVVVSGTPTAGQIPIASSGTAAAWGNPAGSGTVTSVSSTNAAITVATPTTTPALTPVFGTGANTIAQGNDSRIVNALQSLTAADTSITVAGTATAPTVKSNGIATVIVSGTPTSGQVPIASSGTAAAWGTPAAGTVTSVSSTNAAITVATPTTTPAITPVFGTGANTICQGNDSRVVNALQSLTAADTSVTVAGTATAPTVKSNGIGTVIASGTPTSGQVLVASSGTAAAWQYIALTTASGVLGSDVNFTNSDTAIMSTSSLAVGTWHVIFTVSTLEPATAANYDIEVVAGTATATFSGPTAITSRGAAGTWMSTTLNVIATVTGAGTLSFHGQAAAAQTITAKAASLVYGGNATGYTAIRVA